jgi:hypothetical protein
MSNSGEDMDSRDGSAGLAGSPGAMEAFNMGGVGRDVQVESEQPSMRYVLPHFEFMHLSALFTSVHA